MPAKNSIKQYLENGYYHIYNRGVEKRTIFLDSQDHAVFLSYLKSYLLPKKEKELMEKLSHPTISCRERDKILRELRLNNFYNDIQLLAYCLMPNHFHFLIKQAKAESIDKFMNSLCTRYTMYFNRKYKRVGSLYQDVYKAVLVSSEPQLLHLTRYIHSQGDKNLKQQFPSSYYDYISSSSNGWVYPEEILSYFSKDYPNLSYQDFLKQQDEGELAREILIESETD